MKKILLCIIDGWGLGEKNNSNAIHLAKKKNLDKIFSQFDFVKLRASEKQVGLPSGQFGNSEVGHMNIGGGRVILQDILRIEKSFRNKEIEKDKNFLSMISNCKRIHLVGMLSDGGVHGHQNHMFNLINILKNFKNKVFLHCFLDGRDSSPTSGYKNIEKLIKIIDTNKNINIASMCGRFYSMDRDNRWDRIQLAYKAIIEGSLNTEEQAIEAIKKSYENKVTDEFFKPQNFNNFEGVKEDDGFFITNYRADRVRELLTSIFDENFNEFSRRKLTKFNHAISMVEYSKRLKRFIVPLLKPLNVKNNLGEILSKNQLKQLRIAETEKYAHVTYFFNGGLEDSYEGEDRVLIPSPRVETYDTAPEMSANELTDELINSIRLNKYDFVVTNFANPDMVGHTGNMKATIKAVETVDHCIGRLFEECKKNNYTLMITSDHGNADKMIDENKQNVCTTHSINPVPFIICEKIKFREFNGILADIAPTILDLMGLQKPKEMDGKTLII